MVQKSQAFMSVANLGTHTLVYRSETVNSYDKRHRAVQMDLSVQLCFLILLLRAAEAEC